MRECPVRDDRKLNYLFYDEQGITGIQQQRTIRDLQDHTILQDAISNDDVVKNDTRGYLNTTKERASH